MLCEKCKKREATIHLSEIVKDVKSEVHLCEQCAREVGLNTSVSNFNLSLPEMLTFLNVDEFSDQNDGTVCPSCGCTFLQYKRDGRLGCSNCYKYLSELLDPVMISFHGDKKHSGKFPVSYENPAVLPLKNENYLKNYTENSRTTADDLKLELVMAVRDERYEDAALLRDRIKLIESSSATEGGSCDE